MKEDKDWVKKQIKTSLKELDNNVTSFLDKKDAANSTVNMERVVKLLESKKNVSWKGLISGMDVAVVVKATLLSLKSLGEYNGDIYGHISSPGVRDAIAKFQKKHNIEGSQRKDKTWDGVPGPKTIQKILAELNKGKSTETGGKPAAQKSEATKTATETNIESNNQIKILLEKKCKDLDFNGFDENRYGTNPEIAGKNYFVNKIIEIFEDNNILLNQKNINNLFNYLETENIITEPFFQASGGKKTQIEYGDPDISWPEGGNREYRLQKNKKVEDKILLYVASI